MSKRERTKWMNKYKLWVILHPNEEKYYKCLECIYFRRECPKKRLQIIVHDEHPVDTKCIEWIKYV